LAFRLRLNGQGQTERPWCTHPAWHSWCTNNLDLSKALPPSHINSSFSCVLGYPTSCCPPQDWLPRPLFPGGRSGDGLMFWTLPLIFRHFSPVSPTESFCGKHWWAPICSRETVTPEGLRFWPTNNQPNPPEAILQAAEKKQLVREDNREESGGFTAFCLIPHFGASDWAVNMRVGCFSVGTHWQTHETYRQPNGTEDSHLHEACSSFASGQLVNTLLQMQWTHIWEAGKHSTLSCDEMKKKHWKQQQNKQTAQEEQLSLDKHQLQTTHDQPSRPQSKWQLVPNTTPFSKTFKLTQIKGLSENSLQQNCKCWCIISQMKNLIISMSGHR